jgi:ferredoxin
MISVKICKDKCTVCGLCAKICPVGIFKKEEDNIVIIEKLTGRVCMECGQCVAVCPNKAVSLNGEGGIEEEKYNKEILKKQLPLLIKTAQKRKDIKNIPVTEDDIKPILDTVRYSPSAKNMQCVSYTLLTGKSLEDYIKYCYDNIGIIGLDNFRDASSITKTKTCFSGTLRQY